MDFQQAIDQLRNRLKDAQRQGLGGFDTSAAMLEQVAGEAERFRKECLRQAEALEAQAKAARWQADAYSGVSAMAFRVFNGFVNAEEKRLAEEAAAAAEKAEQAATQPEPETPKKRRGKPAE